MSVDKMCLDLTCSTWQWAAERRSATQGLCSICSGGGSKVVAQVAFAVEFRTSPKSPPVGLVPPTLDFLKSGGGRERHHEIKLTASAERNSTFTLKNKLGLSGLSNHYGC